MATDRRRVRRHCRCCRRCCVGMSAKVGHHTLAIASATPRAQDIRKGDAVSYERFVAENSASSALPASLMDSTFPARYSRISQR